MGSLVNNLELKLEKLKLQHNQEKMYLDNLTRALSNPVTELILLFVITEYLQNKTKLLGWGAATSLETAGTLAVGLQQLAPLAPYLAQAGTTAGGMIKDMTGSLGALLPLLALPGPP
jgi:hypothetical protein